MLPFRIGTDLSIRAAGGAVIAVLTPTQALHAAEQLIRKSTRRMMIEEAFAESASSPRKTAVRGGRKVH